MATKKYPIGTKIKFIYDNCDKGKIGVIVGIRTYDGYPYIHLSSGQLASSRCNGKVYSYVCLWSHIEKYITKGEQLLFSFMSE